MPSIHTEIEIAAGAECVWEILSNFAGYSRWNPAIAQLGGICRAGERLRLTGRLRDGIRLTLRPVLLRADSPHELSWGAHLLTRSFFSAEHRFVIETLPSGAVRFTQREDFAGLFSPVFTLLFARGLQQLYEEANRNLKLLAERGIRDERQPVTKAGKPEFAREDGQ